MRAEDLFDVRATAVIVTGAGSGIMGLALFLASPASSCITGAQMVIDGGAALGFAD